MIRLAPAWQGRGVTHLMHAQQNDQLRDQLSQLQVQVDDLQTAIDDLRSVQQAIGATAKETHEPYWISA